MSWHSGGQKCRRPESTTRLTLSEVKSVTMSPNNQQSFERRLAAILAADVAGYTRLMGANEVGTLLALKSHRKDLIEAEVEKYRGRIVKLTGDGILVGSVARLLQSCAPFRSRAICVSATPISIRFAAIPDTRACWSLRVDCSPKLFAKLPIGSTSA
jgi:class 3 adenylate cyclase